MPARLARTEANRATCSAAVERVCRRRSPTSPKRTPDLQGGLMAPNTRRRSAPGHKKLPYLHIFGPPLLMVRLVATHAPPPGPLGARCARSRRTSTPPRAPCRVGGWLPYLVGPSRSGHRLRTEGWARPTGPRGALVPQHRTRASRPALRVLCPCPRPHRPSASPASPPPELSDRAGCAVGPDRSTASVERRARMRAEPRCESRSVSHLAARRPPSPDVSRDPSHTSLDGAQM